MSEPIRCRHCGLKHSPVVFPCPHCQGMGKLNPFDSPVSIEEQLHATKQDRDAWKRRCEAAEKCAEALRCDPMGPCDCAGCKALEKHKAEYGVKP